MPRPCFAKWKKFHNEHTRKMHEGFELVAGKSRCHMSAARILKFWQWYGPDIAARIRDDEPKRQRKMLLLSSMYRNQWKFWIIVLIGKIQMTLV